MYVNTYYDCCGLTEICGIKGTTTVDKFRKHFRESTDSDAFLTAMFMATTVEERNYAKEINVLTQLGFQAARTTFNFNSNNTVTLWICPASVLREKLELEAKTKPVIKKYEKSLL